MILFSHRTYLGICEVVVQRELQLTQLFLFFLLFLPFLLHLPLLRDKNISALNIHHEDKKVRLFNNRLQEITYLLSSLSFTFLFLSATACLPLPHFLRLFLFSEAFLENTEDEACHQDQDHHNNGSYCPHWNCKIEVNSLISIHCVAVCFLLLKGVDVWSPDVLHIHSISMMWTNPDNKEKQEKPKQNKKTGLNVIYRKTS